MLKINYGPKIDYRFCNGCGRCYDECPMDVFGWDEDKDMPTVAYPEDCWRCMFCELACPEIAIDVGFPLNTRIDFDLYPGKSAVDKQRSTDYT